MNWVFWVDAYLAQRRQLGYLLVSEGRYLLGFARFAEQQQCELGLTIELALRWANLAPSGSNIAIARRFSALRPFSRYLRALFYLRTLLVPLIGVYLRLFSRAQI